MLYLLSCIAFAFGSGVINDQLYLDFAASTAGAATAYK